MLFSLDVGFMPNKYKNFVKKIDKLSNEIKDVLFPEDIICDQHSYASLRSSGLRGSCFSEIKPTNQPKNTQGQQRHTNGQTHAS